MKTATILENQTLFDLALQGTGSVLSVIEIALANGIGITDDLEPATRVKLEQGNFYIKDIVDYFDGKQQHLATSGDIDTIGQSGGIGFWILEVDFQVK